jgi:hypothetical protein
MSCRDYQIIYQRSIGLTDVVSLGGNVNATNDKITSCNWNALPWRCDIIDVGTNNSCNFHIMINFFNLRCLLSTRYI